MLRQQAPDTTTRKNCAVRSCPILPLTINVSASFNQLLSDGRMPLPGPRRGMVLLRKKKLHQSQPQPGIVGANYSTTRAIKDWLCEELTLIVVGEHEFGTRRV